jgi:hypothetical protein
MEIQRGGTHVVTVNCHKKKASYSNQLRNCVGSDARRLMDAMIK